MYPQPLRLAWHCVRNKPTKIVPTLLVSSTTINAQVQRSNKLPLFIQFCLHDGRGKVLKKCPPIPWPMHQILLDVLDVLSPTIVSWWICRYPGRPLSLPECRLTSVPANSGTPYVLFSAKVMQKFCMNFSMTLLKKGHMGYLRLMHGPG